MPRVLFFMHTSSPIGGVETWLDRACEHFSLQGFETIVGLVRGQKYNLPERFREYHPKLRTVEIDGRGLNREGRVRALVRCICRASPDFVLPLGIVDANEAVIRCKLRGSEVRLVTHAQGNLEPMLADLAMYRDWIDLVVCPGKLTREILVQWAGFPPDRVLNISNGADEPLRERVARFNGEPIRVGYVGRLSGRDKRALDLVALHRELDQLGVDYRLDIVGDGPCRPELESALGGLEPKVRIHGAISHDSIYSSILPKLDVLTMLSSSEAFGIVLVEAMMHGVVPVSSRYVGFHAEGLVQDGTTGLSFEIGDMRGAALAVKRLVDEPALLAEISANAEAHARLYSWGCALRSWDDALREAMTRPVLLGRTIPTPPPETGLGRLDRLRVPAGVADVLRRGWRSLRGPAVSPGGEEWPLFYRSHSAAALEEIRDACQRLDRPDTHVGLDTRRSTALEHSE